MRSSANATEIKKPITYTRQKTLLKREAATRDKRRKKVVEDMIHKKGERKMHIQESFRLNFNV